MTDPVTALTASAIASLAFQEFVKSGAGDLAKRFTGEAISPSERYANAKMGRLRELIWDRLTGKHPAADEAIEKAKAGEQEGIDHVAVFLGSELLIDQEFAEQVQSIAQEISAGKLLEQSSMTQNNYDNAQGWQTNVAGGVALIGKIHVNDQKHEETQPWWEINMGEFANDPMFEEAMELGRQYRKSSQ
jgi:hypothetical protein